MLLLRRRAGEMEKIVNILTILVDIHCGEDHIKMEDGKV
jgi:hypothetical protein